MAPNSNKPPRPERSDALVVMAIVLVVVAVTALLVWNRCYPVIGCR
jgi:hypothetical protein